MRKIGIERNAYNDYTSFVCDGFEAADYGYFADTEHELFKVSLPEFESMLKEEKKQAEDAGVLISQTHGPWRYPPRDATPEDRAERMEKMKKSLYGTAVLGCPYMVLHPIMPFGDWMKEDDPHRVDFVEMNREFYGELIREAERCGVVICFENMPMTHLPLASAKDSAEFIRSFDTKWLKMCLDTGHGLILGEQPSESIKRDADIIKVLHIHDNQGKGDQHFLPYFGAIDWHAFGKALTYLDESVVFSYETMVSRRVPEPSRTVMMRELVSIARALITQRY